jgi:hypothetical protein
MRALAAMEAVTLHHASKALTFGRANDVHGLANAENTNVDGVAHGGHVPNHANLAQRLEGAKRLASATAATRALAR